MQMNVGSVDRVLRIAVGALLIGLAATGAIGVWGYLGIVPLVSGAFRFCPVYRLLGVNTCTMDRR